MLLFLPRWSFSPHVPCGVGTCIKSVSDLCLFRPFCLARDFSGTGSSCGGRGCFAAIQEASLAVQERPAFRCSHQRVFSLHTHTHTETGSLYVKYHFCHLKAMWDWPEGPLSTFPSESGAASWPVVWDISRRELTCLRSSETGGSMFLSSSGQHVVAGGAGRRRLWSSPSGNAPSEPWL